MTESRLRMRPIVASHRQPTYSRLESRTAREAIAIPANDQTLSSVRRSDIDWMATCTRAKEACVVYEGESASEQVSEVSSAAENKRRVLRVLVRA